MLLYNSAAETLANFINADKRIKGIQIGDHDIKQVNFVDNSTILMILITLFSIIPDGTKQVEVWQKKDHV